MALTPDDLKAIGELLAPLREEQNKQGEILESMRKDVRKVKLKVHKTWRLLSWFSKDADERIVAVEKAIKHN